MHVLYIEDDSRDVELARVALFKSGLPVGFAAVPDEEGTLDYLLCRGEYTGRQPEPPAVIFLDLSLGGSRGTDLITAIRSHPKLSWVPIVMLTTSHHRSDVEECYRLGANAYMVKPIGYAEFAIQFRQAVSFWTRANLNAASGGSSPE